MYYQSKAEIEEHIQHAGEQAVFEANIGTMHEELVKLLGRLRFRTSYGQNILKHSLECAHLAGNHGFGARRKRQDGEARGLAPRHRQGAYPRGRGHARGHLGPAGEEVRRVAARRPRHRGAPLRGAAADRRGDPRHHGRRDLGLAPGRARREPRELHQAARDPRGAGVGEEGRRARLRPPGRPGDPRHGEARGRRATTRRRSCRTRSRARSRPPSSTRARSRSR